jgi:hypothetical protein
MYYIYVSSEVPERPVTADRLLRSMGASGRLTGFKYVVYMVNAILTGESSTYQITKRLYPETAKHFCVNAHSVESAIRTMINSCWQYGDRTAMSSIAGHELKRPPSNTEFVDMLVACLQSID